jgi:hypothetical protein
MVSSTESIGRLITNEVLLQAERQLLRNQGQSKEEPQEQPSQPASAPISHNDKAVASVLLTLLDEQLDAAAATREFGGNFAQAQADGAEAAPGTTRIVSQYAEAESAFRPDLPVQQAPHQADSINQQALLAAASPELRMAMQSAFLSAAVRAKADIETVSGSDARRRKTMRETTGVSPLRIGTGVCVAIILGIVLLAKFSR